MLAKYGYIWLSKIFRITEDELRKVVMCTCTLSGRDEETVLEVIGDNTKPYSSISRRILYYEHSNGEDLFATDSMLPHYQMMFIINSKEVRAVVPFKESERVGKFYDRVNAVMLGKPALCSIDTTFDTKTRKVVITKYKMLTDTPRTPQYIRGDIRILSKEMLCAVIGLLEEVMEYAPNITVTIRHGVDVYDTTIEDLKRGCK